MTAHLVNGEAFTALTVTDTTGATLNVERTDDGNLSAWIAPPNDNDGHSVRLSEADLIGLVAYLSADTSGALVPASEAKRWHDRYAAAHNALRSLAVAYVDATGQPAPTAVTV